MIEPNETQFKFLLIMIVDCKTKFQANNEFHKKCGQRQRQVSLIQ